MGILLFILRYATAIFSNSALAVIDSVIHQIRFLLSDEQYTPLPLFLQAQNVGFMGILPLFRHVWGAMVSLSSLVNQRLLIFAFFCFSVCFFPVLFHFDPPVQAIQRKNPETDVPGSFCTTIYSGVRSGLLIQFFQQFLCLFQRRSAEAEGPPQGHIVHHGHIHFFRNGFLCGL